MMRPGLRSMLRDQCLIFAAITLANSAPALAQGSYPNPAECAAACRVQRAFEPEVRRPCSPPDVITPMLQQLALDIVSDTSAAGTSFRAHHGMQASSASDVMILRSDRMCDAVTAGIERIGLPHVAEAYQTIQIGLSVPFYLAARREDFLKGGNVFLLNPRLEVVVQFGH